VVASQAANADLVRRIREAVNADYQAPLGELGAVRAMLRVDGGAAGLPRAATAALKELRAFVERAHADIRARFDGGDFWGAVDFLARWVRGRVGGQRQRADGGAASNAPDEAPARRRPQKSSEKSEAASTPLAQKDDAKGKSRKEQISKSDVDAGG
jgi:hypothetical protein